MSTRIVIKFGTSTLTNGGKKISMPRLVDIARQVSELQAQGQQVVIVSSGAIAAGRELLGFPALPKYIPAKQMLAAIGQPRLMALYEQIFTIYNIRVAQILLTRSDLSDRRRYLNARSTLEALIQQGIVPIINENDTIATEEIRFGDNDNLSAQVASLIEADSLLLLTDQEGLYTADPRQDATAKLLHEISPEPFPDSLWVAAGGSASGLGTGGMMTKLQAADLARRSGATVIIAQGSLPNVLSRLAEGELLGTKFPPMINKLEGRKRYILSTNRTGEEIKVDAGAVRALAHGGSLLPAGVVEVTGDFDRGDTVRVVDPNGKVIAAGLTHYSAADLKQICGHQSGEIETILGFTFGDEVIHRNHLVLLS
jgi:glutamate 5-kinase